MLKWVKEEVSFWITRLEEFSGQRIRHSVIESGLPLIGPEAKGRVVRYGNDNYAAMRVVEYGY